MFHPAATCRGAIADNIDLGLVDEFKMVSALTRRPVKITMTGPLMLTKVAYDEHYADSRKMMLDLGKLLNHNFRLLAAAGCKNIQVDEPLFTISDEAEAVAGVEAINLAIEGLPADIHIAVHLCQGNYAVGKEYDGQVGHRYFDHGRYKVDKICGIACAAYLVELGVGAVDVQDPKVETGEVVAERILAHRWLAPEQTIVTSSCGLNHLPRKTAFGKLQAMTAAKRVLGG